MLNLFAYRMSNGKIANYDEKTGMHYGVISQHSVTDFIWEDFEDIYEFEIECPKCNTLYTGDGSENCPECGAEPDDNLEFVDVEPSARVWNGDKGYSLEYAESLSAFYVTLSPYYTYTALCSPCAPNAGDLDSPSETGVKTYCLDASFFDKDYAPMPYQKLYRVSDDTEVTQ